MGWSTQDLACWWLALGPLGILAHWWQHSELCLKRCVSVPHVRPGSVQKHLPDSPLQGWSCSLARGGSTWEETTIPGVAMGEAEVPMKVEKWLLVPIITNSTGTLFFSQRQ